MDAIQEYLKRPLIAGAAGFVGGLFIGLVVLGWWLWPVEFVDADPSHMRSDLQADYLNMAIIAYAETKDTELAKSRYAALGEDAEDVLEAVISAPGGAGPEKVQSFLIAVSSAESEVAAGGPEKTEPVEKERDVEATVLAAAEISQEEEPAEETKEESSNLFRSLLPMLCVGSLVLGAGLGVGFVMRSRGATIRKPAIRKTAPAVQPRYTDQENSWMDYPVPENEPPMAQFMASYRLGDDLFDDSFSIDSPAGEFLGECGVGISETIGVGEPKKVTAFETWLFDKNDIQTVTKVLMSAHAFTDDGNRQRLAAKGEPILIEPGTEAVLETETLQLVARVVDMGYGDGAMPSKSFFDRFVIELAVWQKPNA